MLHVDSRVLVKEARRWVGVPYQHQGRSEAGVDCVGLAICIAKDLYLTKFDVNDYSQTPSHARMRRLLDETCVRLEGLSEVNVGDLLYLAYDKQPRHLAIVTMLHPIYIVHADAMAGKVIEQRLAPEYFARIRGCYRIPGVQHDDTS